MVYWTMKGNGMTAVYGGSAQRACRPIALADTGS